MEETKSLSSNIDKDVEKHEILHFLNICTYSLDVASKKYSPSYQYKCVTLGKSSNIIF